MVNECGNTGDAEGWLPIIMHNEKFPLHFVFHMMLIYHTVCKQKSDIRYHWPSVNGNLATMA